MTFSIPGVSITPMPPPPNESISSRALSRTGTGSMEGPALKLNILLIEETAPKQINDSTGKGSPEQASQTASLHAEPRFKFGLN